MKKSMNRIQYVISAFLIALVVFPCLIMIIKLLLALMQLALQNPSEDKAVIDFYAVQQTEVSP